MSDHVQERFELRFPYPRFPSIDMAEFAGECVTLVSKHLIPMGLDRVEVLGDGIAAFVVVPRDPNIRLTHFDKVREEIQKELGEIVRRHVSCGARERPAWRELERLDQFLDALSQPNEPEYLHPVDRAIALLGRQVRWERACTCPSCRLHRTMSGGGEIEPKTR